MKFVLVCQKCVWKDLQFFFFVCFTASSAMIVAKQTFGVQMIIVKSMIGKNHQWQWNVILSYTPDATWNTVKISKMHFLRMFTKAATLNLMKNMCTLHYLSNIYNYQALQSTNILFLVPLSFFFSPLFEFILLFAPFILTLFSSFAFFFAVRFPFFFHPSFLSIASSLLSF